MTQNLTQGQEFSGRARCLSRARILALSGGALGSAEWPRRNLHTDPEKAAEAGLPAPIASGIQGEGDMVRLLIALFGERWFSFGKLNVTHRRPVFEGTWLQARARIGAKTRSGTGHVVNVEVWCETSDKDIVSAGQASCVIEGD
jgi:acyl dehydratase